MSLQFLGGTTSQNDNYTGPARSITVDIEKWELRLHDGVTQGGAVIGSIDGLPNASDTQDGLMSAEDKRKLDELSTSEAPVTSVAGRTGNVTLSASDISGLSRVASSGDYEDLKNKPSIPTMPDVPVQSVNGKTGNVVLGANDISDLVQLIRAETGITKDEEGTYVMDGDFRVAGAI